MIYILDPRDNENQFLYNFVSFDDDQNNGVQTGQWQIKDHEGIIQNVVRGSKRGSLDSGNEALTIQNQPKLIQTISVDSAGHRHDSLELENAGILFRECQVYEKLQIRLA